jgi:hypothetical protein
MPIWDFSRFGSIILCDIGRLNSRLSSSRNSTRVTPSPRMLRICWSDSVPRTQSPRSGQDWRNGIDHDWIDVPGWTHGTQVQLVVGRRKLWIATLINAVFPGIAVAFAFTFWNRLKPAFVTSYWVLYCAVTLASAILMWYIPYFLGATERTKQDYLRMYAGTKHVLPPRKDNPRPNLLHLSFHLLFIVNFCLALSLRFRRF